ncbi:MFS transporter, partial [Streptomyces anulatus]|uniref:MFS transporter n=1 Tax=Streptomyces anulatus TaxID=1892 RepID=UPI0034228988
IGAFSLASFSALWTALTLLLSGSPYGWPESAIGLVGLVGAVGALTATVAGRLADRGFVQVVSGTGAFLLVASWAALTAGAHSLLWLLVGVVVLDLAHQAVLNSSQNVLYALRPEVRNRINSAFLTTLFVGGAAGSALASAAWVRGGWSGVCVVGATLSAGTVVLWLLERATVGQAAGRAQKTLAHQSHDTTPAVSAD